jgi:hypothetical protein
MKETDENVLPTKEEVLMDEDRLLAGLFEAAQFKDDEQNIKLVKVVRNGKLLFEFRIRPLEEEELDECREKATKYIPNPNGRHLPKIEDTTNIVRLRSYKIYAATIEEDRKKVWNNTKLKDKLNVLSPIDVIDAVLMAGEKEWIINEIDILSGYGVSREEYAKN